MMLIFHKNFFVTGVTHWFWASQLSTAFRRRTADLSPRVTPSSINRLSIADRGCAGRRVLLWRKKCIEKRRHAKQPASTPSPLCAAAFFVSPKENTFRPLLTAGLEIIYTREARARACFHHAAGVPPMPLFYIIFNGLLDALNRNHIRQG
jgi:hypothetical protein